MTTETVALARALDACDAALGEVGRRAHRFWWLRPPGGGIEDCLAVDAYYPRRRLVVCASLGEEQRALCRELVPAHGLGLIELDAEELACQPAELEHALLAELDRRQRHSPPIPAGQVRPRSVVRPPRRTVAAAGVGATTTVQQQRFGLLLGIALGAVLAAETLLLTIGVALRGGQVLLASGLALDALARGLGTLAAARAGERRGAWRNLIVGSPAVLGVTLRRLEQEAAPPEPELLAGAIAALALLALALALVGLLLGI